MLNLILSSHANHLLSADFVSENEKDGLRICCWWFVDIYEMALSCLLIDRS